MNSLYRVNYSNATPYTEARSSSSASNNAIQSTALSEDELFEKDLKEWEKCSGLYTNVRHGAYKPTPNDIANRIRYHRREDIGANDRLLLKDCQLRSLPRAVFTLTSLERVYLCSNLFEVLPEEIGLLTNLTSLDLSNNSLKELPRSIGKLTKLVWLRLQKNQLETVPSEIGCLENLSRLELQENPLKTLPSEMVRLTHLEEFTIPFDLTPLFEEEKLAQLERDGVITTPQLYCQTWKTVTDVVTFIKNTKDFVDVEELFGDIKNADTRS